MWFVLVINLSFAFAYYGSEESCEKARGKINSAAMRYAAICVPVETRRSVIEPGR